MQACLRIGFDAAAGVAAGQRCWIHNEDDVVNVEIDADVEYCTYEVIDNPACARKCI